LFFACKDTIKGSVVIYSMAAEKSFDRKIGIPTMRLRKTP
jgi:hypothetical protein